MSDVQIVFDIGGSKMRVGAVSAGKLEEVEITDTAESPEIGFQQLLELSKKASKGRSIERIVGDAPGVVKDGVLIKAPNLPLWSGTNIEEVLEKEFGVKADVFNDTELVGLGEYYFGAGKGSKRMAYITVSTGVGGCLIEEGEPRRGEYNPEIGHQLVRGDTLESQISGTAVEKKYGKHPKDIDDPEVWSEVAIILAEGLYDNILHWSPDTIVLGGSMITGEGNVIPIDHVEEELEKLIKTIYPHAPTLKKAQLSKLGGLYGGIAFLDKTNI